MQWSRKQRCSVQLELNLQLLKRTNETQQAQLQLQMQITTALRQLIEQLVHIVDTNQTIMQQLKHTNESQEWEIKLLRGQVSDLQLEMQRHGAIVEFNARPHSSTFKETLKFIDQASRTNSRE